MTPHRVTLEARVAQPRGMRAVFDLPADDRANAVLEVAQLLEAPLGLWRVVDVEQLPTPATTADDPLAKVAP